MEWIGEEREREGDERRMGYGGVGEGGDVEKMGEGRDRRGSGCGVGGDMEGCRGKGDQTRRMRKGRG